MNAALRLIGLLAVLSIPSASAGPLSDAEHAAQGMTDPVAQCVGSLGKCGPHPCAHDDCPTAQDAVDAAEKVVGDVGCGDGCVAVVNDTANAVLALAGGPVDGALALVNDALASVDPADAVALLNDTSRGLYDKSMGTVLGAYGAVYATGDGLARLADSTVPWYVEVQCGTPFTSSFCTIWFHRAGHVPDPFA
jgi:hypothetical protein